MHNQIQQISKKSKISEKSLNSPQPHPSMNQNKKKTVESTSDKNEFWSKFFFSEKSNIPPPPLFSPKNASRVVTPTENGQIVQFQVLRP